MLRVTSQALTVLACLLAVAAVVTFLVQFQKQESTSGSLGLVALGVACLVLVLRRLDRS